MVSKSVKGEGGPLWTSCYISCQSGFLTFCSLLICATPFLLNQCQTFTGSLFPAHESFSFSTAQEVKVVIFIFKWGFFFFPNQVERCTSDPAWILTKAWSDNSGKPNKNGRLFSSSHTFLPSGDSGWWCWFFSTIYPLWMVVCHSPTWAKRM